MAQIIPISDEVKHSAAHVLALAVKRQFPDVKIGIGPVTKEGFYYDFDLGRKFTDDDKKAVESNILQIIQEDLPFSQFYLNKEKAITMLLQSGQGYKAELVKAIPDEEISFFKLGEEFTDLCRGPHLKSSGYIGIILIDKITETHWKEDPKRPKMERIHGVVFRNAEELNNYQKAKVQEKAKDFKKISEINKLGFLIDENFYLTNRGTSVNKQIEKIITSKVRGNRLADEITVPTQKSVEDITNSVDKYLSVNNHSYKDFPKYFFIRTNVKSKVKNDIEEGKAIIFVNYLKSTDAATELGKSIENTLDVFKELSLEVFGEILCSNLDNPYLETISNILKADLISHNKILTKNRNEITLILKVKDSISREWNLCVINLRSENTPKFINDANVIQNTVVLENIFPILNIYAYFLENSDGELPLILKPVKVKCIPLTRKQHDFAKEIQRKVIDMGYSVEIDLRANSMQQKIKDAESEGIPIILVLGNKEAVNQAVSIRQNSIEVGLISLENLDEYLSENLNY